MTGGIFYSANEALGRVFPERRIYVRSDAGTRYWTLSPISQCGLACVFCAFIGWSGFTSASFIGRAMDGQTLENRLAATQETHEIQLAALRKQQRLLEEELNRSNMRGDTVTRQLSMKQRLLVETSADYQVAEAELSGLREEYETLLSERRAERDRINELHEQVVEMRLALAETKRDDAVMQDTLRSFTHTMGQVITERDTAAERAQTLDVRVAELEGEIIGWQGRQENLLAQLEEATSSSLDSLDAIFVDSDIDLESILKQTKHDFTGRGGPFEEFSRDKMHPAADPSADDDRIAALMGGWSASA